jgi:hypothetical protein
MKALIIACLGLYLPAQVSAGSSGLAALQTLEPAPFQIPEPVMGESDTGTDVRATASWTGLASGAWLQNTGSGSSLFIAFPGYSVKEAGAKNWALAVAKGGNYGAIVTFLGPNQSGYANDELKAANNALVKKIAELKPSKITIVAHSSGGFVSREFFQLFSGSGEYVARTAYFDLDGAFCDKCAALQSKYPGFSYQCISARQGGLDSPNIASSQSCGSGHYVLLTANSGCTGKWCLHAWLVNERAAKINANQPDIETYYSDPSIIPCNSFLGR